MRSKDTSLLTRSVSSFTLVATLTGLMILYAPAALGQGAPVHIARWAVNPAPASDPHLNYYGGPVAAYYDLVLVYWGNNVSGVVTNNFPGFYNVILPSTYISGLSEYNTPTQTITAGGLRGPYTITPSRCPVGPCHLNDVDIQNEIRAQVAATHLPPPATSYANAQRTEYFVYFPPQVTISDPNGAPSCQPGGFCAYHGTGNAMFGTMLYGVVPDFGPGSGCDVGCGAGTELQNLESVSTHEVAETITDADVGFAQIIGYPLAWYDPLNGEIGDICNQEEAQFMGFTVQKLWSNAQNACVIL